VALGLALSRLWEGRYGRHIMRRIEGPDDLAAARDTIDDADVAAGSASSPTAGDLRPADAQQVRRWHPVTGQEAVHMRGGRVAWLAGVDHRDTPTRPAEHQRCAEPGRAATDHDDVPPVSG
jgi:hypothetical protein